MMCISQLYCSTFMSTLRSTDNTDTFDGFGGLNPETFDNNPETFDGFNGLNPETFDGFNGLDPETFGALRVTVTRTHSSYTISHHLSHLLSTQGTSHFIFLTLLLLYFQLSASGDE